MLYYEKLSKSTRTRTALMLLLLFMLLAVADLFISFFGGLVLGILLVQFEWEAQRFVRRMAGKAPKIAGAFSGLTRRFESLGNENKLKLYAGLLALIFILMLTGLLHTFWGGVQSGVLLLLTADAAMRYQQRRERQKITIKKN